MRLLGSLAVLADVSFFFIPDILAQKDFLREPPSGCGALSPGFPGLALLYEARPLAFKPPLGFLPSLRVQAGDLAILSLRFLPRDTSEDRTCSGTDSLRYHVHDIWTVRVKASLRSRYVIVVPAAQDGVTKIAYL